MNKNKNIIEIDTTLNNDTSTHQSTANLAFWTTNVCLKPLKGRLKSATTLPLDVTSSPDEACRDTPRVVLVSRGARRDGTPRAGDSHQAVLS